MDGLKRILGYLWLALALAATYFCVVVFGIPKLYTGNQEDLVFGIIILFVLTPLIVLGLGIFGFYAIKGEYDKDKL